VCATIEQQDQSATPQDLTVITRGEGGGDINLRLKKTQKKGRTKKTGQQSIKTMTIKEKRGKN